MLAYAVLFLSAFAAATVLPLQSEAVLLALLAKGHHSAIALLFFASLGNILGACVNWYLGLKIEHYKDQKWFPLYTKQMTSAQLSYQKYGYWTLLLSWVPIIGDPITLIAGLLKENFTRFLLLVSLAKVGRYLFLYGIFYLF